jgi:outer membrane protein OmpA-like peptidoglycan-associated protein
MILRRASSADAGRLAIAFLTATLAACTARVGTVVLLPDAEGRDTAVVVRRGDQVVTLDKPYAAADVTVFGAKPYASTAADVAAEFGPALAARPEPPVRFIVYFVEGTDALTDASKAVFETVFGELSRRRAPDIVVIGHTDLVGTDVFNDALARRRAESVRAALLTRGIAADQVVAVGRGKREPAIATPDGVAEPLNRRVEILVR